MKGIELSERFFLRYKDELLEEYAPYVSVGLVGNGSECFGFDDEISRDHDFDAGFCIWVDDGVSSELPELLEKRYASLPRSFMGVEKKANSLSAEKRRGVFLCSAFYKGLIGIGRAPSSPEEWLKIPDYALAAATNGKVFTDNATDFTYVRNTLINGIPNDVILKKLSRALVIMAQSGQYNYTRCIRHGEAAAARLALNEFILHSAACVYYLNRRFPPFYKWLFRGMRELRLGREVGELLSSLLLNTSYAECADNIERICGIVLAELKRRDITYGNEDYLEPHAFRTAAKIRDGTVRNMHIME